MAKNDTEWHQNDYADYRAHQFESATPTVPRPSATDRLDPTKLACGAPGLVASLFYSRGQTHAAYSPQYGQFQYGSGFQPDSGSAARAAAVGIGAELLVAGADAAVAVLAVLVAGAGADAAAGIGADAAVAVIAEVIAAMIAELLVAGADAGAAARFGAAAAARAPPDRSHQRQ